MKTEIKSIKSFEDIRTILGSELIDARAGKSSPSKASAVANVAGKYLGAIKLQLEMLKLSQEKPDEDLKRFLLSDGKKNETDH
jgi:hypothetical protein